MTLQRYDLENMVKDGLVSDIFRAERAIELLKVSGSRAAQINGRREGFAPLFDAIQASLNTEALLALSRIFDKPSKQYPTRCLCGVLAFLAKRSTELPSVREPHQLKISLRAMNASDQLISTVNEQPANFATMFAAFVDEILRSTSNIQTLEKLKILRDKRLAHNEQTSEFDGPLWSELILLLELAKQVVGVLGWAYFSVAYMPNGKYLLTDDALRPSRALTRLLDQVYGAEAPS